MGGGHPDIKMRMSLKDFEKIYDDKVIIGDITFDKWGDIYIIIKWADNMFSLLCLLCLKTFLWLKFIMLKVGVQKLFICLNIIITVLKLFVF